MDTGRDSELLLDSVTGNPVGEGPLTAKPMLRTVSGKETSDREETRSTPQGGTALSWHHLHRISRDNGKNPYIKLDMTELKNLVSMDIHAMIPTKRIMVTKKDQHTEWIGNPFFACCRDENRESKYNQKLVNMSNREKNEMAFGTY